VDFEPLTQNWGNQTAASGEFPWPLPGRSVSARGEDLMAADSGTSRLPCGPKPGGCTPARHSPESRPLPAPAAGAECTGVRLRRSAAGPTAVDGPDASLRHRYRSSVPGKRGAEPPTTSSGGTGQGQVQATASMGSFKETPSCSNSGPARLSANYRRAGDSGSGPEQGQGNSRAGSLEATVVPSTRPKSSFRGPHVQRAASCSRPLQRSRHRRRCQPPRCRSQDHRAMDRRPCSLPAAPVRPLRSAVA